MCTLSWWLNGVERGVLFNRDEKRARAYGRPPERVEFNSESAALMPYDPDAGGTWIGVNDRGLIVAILNNYPYFQSVDDGKRSRGLLVTDLLRDASDVETVERLVRTTELWRYRGFVLFAYGLKDDPIALRWDGEGLESLVLSGKDALPVLTTSSVRRDDCESFRGSRFANCPREPEALRQQHQYYHAPDPALGSLMSREDAGTDSITEIELFEDHAEMCYQSVRGMVPTLGAIERKSLVLIAR